MSSPIDPDSLTDPNTLPFGIFEKVAETLVAKGGDAIEIHQLSRERCVFMFHRAFLGVQVVLLRYDGQNPEATKAALSEAVKTATGGAVDLILVGGDASARTLLKKARPFFTRRPVGLLHLGDGLKSWASKLRATGRLLLPADKKLMATTSDEASWNRLVEQSSESQTQWAEHAQELAAFATLVNGRKPVVTWALAGIIGVVFGLQLLAGGGDSPVGYVRMGALVPGLVAAGEWWRLISCTFLHAGWMHVLLNVYVLLLLGTFLERIIGKARFLTLYGISAIAGSLGSVAFLKASFSVGASGAIWGLLGAHAILAYRSKGLLPQAMIKGAQKAALINLGLNILNSFRPHVDMWAHFAGGAAGALLLASTLLTRGLPRLGELEQRADGSAPEIARDVPTSKGLWVAAGASALVLLTGLVLAIAMGEPFAIGSGKALTRTPLKTIGVSLALPQDLAQRGASAREKNEQVFGSPLSDPMTVSAWTLKLPKALTKVEAQGEIASLKKSLAAPKNAKLLSPPTGFEHRGELGLTVSYRYPSRLIHERAFLFRGDRFLRVEVLRWPDFRKSAPQGAARKIAESAKPL